MALQFSNIRLITIIEIKLFIKLAPNVRASAIVMNVINKTLLSDINIKKKTKKKRSYEFSDILVYRVISTDTPALSSRSSTSAAQTFLKQSILAQLCHLHRLVIIAMLTIVFIIQTRASVLSVTIFRSETRCVCIKLRTARRSC